MSGEESKQVVRRWFEAVNQGDPAEILKLLSEDFSFEAMLRQPQWMKYTWNREQFAATPAAMSSLMTSPIILHIVSMIGEDDKVAVEATTDSVMKNGKHYDNAYHFVFSFRDGTISEVREYCCTYLVEECFGGFNPNNPAAKSAPV